MIHTYIIVADVVDRKVIKVTEFPQVTFDNVRNVAEAIGDSWYTTSREFPAPQYDIFRARAENFESVQDWLPTLQGWDAVSLESLSL